ncbi:SH3 domain-containing YSC84-like protein 1 isoform X2 [Physeter macrocephalus]|uniref:SH3 domain-containing YSC84-like protein 1 isoform X2 n=1 Tax=Physeter macrocephalus TaxID=9755 RepID=A0A9W2X0Z6_PHYMC|nr:SH3 domain-containing YSC84-like protein 1 isoform X2 [Physeter catodon]XP_054944995.1 SH3 domain-containing YSC84-like protein 1 isoform X2 [Physeter catodon]
MRAGFLVTARGGGGIVLARLPGGKWSAPSAIGIAGLGGGFELGIEVSDLVIILNYDRAVEAFAKGGNLTLGGNLTVAVGPLGRNLEGDVSLRSSAAVFTYCKSRGLFAGISLEGSCLIERKETNRKFYCQDIRAYDILFGDIPRPAEAEDLYEILNSFTEKYENEGQRINARKAAREKKKGSAKELPSKPLSRPQQSSAQVQLNPGSQSNRNEYNLYPELSSYRERVALQGKVTTHSPEARVENPLERDIWRPTACPMPTDELQFCTGITIILQIVCTFALHPLEAPNHLVIWPLDETSLECPQPCLLGFFCN